MSESRLVLASTGRAGDASYLAAADLAEIATTLDVPYRLVGGNAVTLLVAVHGVDHLVPARETADADFGAEPHVVADPRLVQELLGHGYRRTGGNRFVRTQTLPSLGGAPAASRDLVVDVLAPSYQGRLVANQPHGALVVDEVPGLTPSTAATSATAFPASTRSSVLRRNSGGYPRRPIRASSAREALDSSNPPPKNPGHTRASIRAGAVQSGGASTAPRVTTTTRTDQPLSTANRGQTHLSSGMTKCRPQTA